MPERSSLDSLLEKYHLQDLQLETLHPRLILLKKQNWDYLSCWNFQKDLLQLMNENFVQYIIFTSHPDVLTYGKGLQKSRPDEKKLELIETPIEKMTQLNLPFYQIERGGGLTFHHLGQFIVYPLMHLHPDRLGLSKIVDDLLHFTSRILQNEGLTNLQSKRNPLGLWREDKKLASIGIAVDRMKTYHGMALNLHPFHHLKDYLQNFAPCGLQMSTYTSVEEVLRKYDWEEMAQQFKKEIQHAW
jgi:lipoyl(octanoyl) transferase